MGLQRMRAAAWPLAGFAVTYVLFQVLPWGRYLDTLSMHGRHAAGWKIRMADRMVMETISVASVAVVLLVVLAVAVRRGRDRAGVWSAGAVVGSLLSVEVLKIALPSADAWTGEWRWLTSQGSFPSGHSMVAASLTLAVLSVSSDRWRRILVGPLVAWVAVVTTATVTLGWHTPSDVLGSFFLATAWHRACTADRPAERRLRAMLPTRQWSIPGAVPAVLCWSLACAVVLGAAVKGVLDADSMPYGPPIGPAASFAYVASLVVMLAGAWLTVSRGPVPVPATPPARRDRHSTTV